MTTQMVVVNVLKLYFKNDWVLMKMKDFVTLIDTLFCGKILREKHEKNALI